MKSAAISFILAFCVTAFAFQDYKKIFEEGISHLESGNHAKALPLFQEAYRLNPEAERYREEGSFFRNYMPRYYIALAMEPSDIMDALHWVDLSLEANEEKPIKKKEERADYHANIKRIKDAAAEFSKNRDRNFRLALSKAEQLLNAKKFAQAQTAYEALVNDYPEKTEAQSGLSSIADKKNLYLKNLSLDIRSAIMSKNFTQAEGVINQIAQVDDGYSELPILKAELKNAVAAVEQAKEAAQVAKAEEKPKVTTPNRPQRDPQAERLAEAKRREREQLARQAELKEALLATLENYRIGRFDTALSDLEKIESPLREDSQSFHWLRSIYLLGSYHHSGEPRDELLDKAKESIQATHRLSPSFKPDPDLYPPYVIQYFEKVTGS